MNNNNDILLCSDNIDYYRLLSRRFKEYGMNMELSADDEKLIIKRLYSKKYGAVMISVFNDCPEKISTVKIIRNTFPETAIAVLSYTSMYRNCREFIFAGAERCLILPQSPVNICNCIMHMLNDQHLYLQETYDFMTDCGFPCHLNGFYYFCSATELYMSQYPDSISGIYAAVAERFGTTPDIIESSIRHFINVSHSKGVIKRFMNCSDFRPSNYELIRFAAGLMKESYEIFRGGKMIKKNERNKFNILVYSSLNELL